MDYKRIAIEKKEEELASSSRSVQRRIGLFALRILLIAFISLVVVIGAGGIGAVTGIIANAPDINDISISPSGFATFIYDSDGNLLQKLTSSDSNRTAVSLDSVPVDLQHAVVAIEDARFYQHNGIDAKGIIRAMVVGLRNRFKFTEGASTITQQLLKNNVFTTWTQEKTLIDRVKRKFQEQYLAVKLEERLKAEDPDGYKDLILENYLNTINLGAGTYGVQAASKKYFNRDVQNLTLSEATVIAGITQNPSKFNPITHPDKNAERRERILTKMVEQGYISEADKQNALADTDAVYRRIADAQVQDSSTRTVYTYFIDELTDQVVNDLQDLKGYTETQAYQLLYSGGLTIYTTQDAALQQICDEEYADPSNFPDGTQYSLDWALSVTHEDGSTENYSKEMLQKYFREHVDTHFDLLFDSEAEGQKFVDDYKAAVMVEGDSILAERTTFAPQPQSSLVLMDQKTGYVKAIVGGRGEKSASLVLNRATNSTRQPGSLFKILSTYAPALSSGEITLGTAINDAEYEYSDGTKVKNSDDTYAGWVTVRQAIINSINIPAVKVITQITPEVGYEQLLKFGFTTLDAAHDIYQPLSLGGIYKGVTNLELTAAFASIANEGTYTKPIFYTKILDQNGNVLIDNTTETRTALDKDTAWLLTSAMEDVVKMGTAQDIALTSNIPVAGKTGTTSDYKDIWFIGYTPYYTMGIWAGYDNNESLPDEGIYRTYHKIIWGKIMNRIMATQKYKDFNQPSDVKQVAICGVTGLLATRRCRHTAYEWVAADSIPTEYCNETYATYYAYPYASDNLEEFRSSVINAD